MQGDTQDMAARMRSVLPAGWFGDVTPVLDAVLSGVGAAWSAMYSLIQTVQAESRLLSASGAFLDMFAADFFATWLQRWVGEGDNSFRTRIGLELLRPRSTRSALARAVLDMTGRAPVVFEPRRPADTGGYGAGGAGWGVAGGWGSLQLPFQVFVTAYRPCRGGIAIVAGYGTGGPLVYADPSWVAPVATDQDIAAAVARVLPCAVTAWLRISD
jgi:hypothetical protein